MRRLLESALDSLPQNCRTVLLLIDFEGVSASETADCLNLPEDGIDAILEQARVILKRALFDAAMRASPFAFEAPCDRIVERVMSRIRARE